MRETLIVGGLMLLITGSCLAQTSPAAADRVETQIAPQALGSALRKFAEGRHMQVLFLTADVKDLKTAGATGKLTADQALSELLTGTGLKYRYVDANAVSVVPDRPDGATARELNRLYLFNIAAEPLSEALLQFRAQVHVQIVFAWAPTKERTRTKALKGYYTGKEALVALLSGTQFGYVEHGNIVEIAHNQVNGSTTAQQPSPTDDPPSDRKKRSVSGRKRAAELRQVTITGTYIPKSAPLSPVITLTHEQLAEQGYTNLDDAIAQLPENFLGGGTSQVSNTVNQAGTLSAYNTTFSSSVNLRGLGPGTTLVLLNGMRLAPTSSGFSTDIAQIPLSAIDHVEIVPDGNSALYGSDAVGGVINIITVKHYSGVESGIRMSDIASGMQPSEGGNILGGESWGSGGVVANFDFEQDHPLYARNRSFTSDAPDPTTLLIEQSNPSAYLSLRQGIGDRWSVSALGLWSSRRFESPDQTSTVFTLTGGQAEQTSGALEINYAVSSEWSATLSGQYSRELDDYTFVYYFSPVSTVSANQRALEEKAGDIRVNGRLVELPGGALSMALGSGTRRELYDDKSNLSAHAASREVDSVYGELLVPIVGVKNSMPLITQLRLDLAGRYDRYSDFGSTTNPKVSVEWWPFEAMSFSGSYGKSFRAPPLYSLSPTEIAEAYVLDAPDLSSPTGTARVVDLDGTNPNLTAETAKTLDVNATYRPLASNASLRISYFDIQYDNRITRLITDGYFANVLLQAAALGPLVNLNPTAAQISAALAGRNVISYVGAWTPDSIQAIANIGFENAASLLVRGFDLNLADDDIETRTGRFRLNITGTYYATYRQRIAPNSIWTSLQNTTLNPLRFRAVGNIGWNVGRWGANARLNYANEYRNPADLTCGTPSGCEVSSWTTTDLALSYIVRPGEGPLAGWRASLSVANIFDRAPPHVGAIGTTEGLNYDPTNASPLGRAFALTLTKEWGAAR